MVFLINSITEDEAKTRGYKILPLRNSMTPSLILCVSVDAMLPLRRLMST